MFEVKTTIQVFQLSIQILIHSFILGKPFISVFFPLEKNSCFQYLCKRRIQSKRGICLSTSFYYCGLNFKISKLNKYHSSQSLNSEAKKKNERKKIIFFVCFGKVEIYSFIGTQNCSPSYINAYIFIIKFGTYLVFF